MKIRIVNWKLNDVGGITTWVIAVRDSLKAMGHEVCVFHVSEKTKMKVFNKDTETKRATAIAGEFRSIRDKDKAESLCEDLNSCDLIIFAHSSPHPTRTQLKRVGVGGWVGVGKMWQYLYKKLTVPRVVVFHDNNWEKTNPWLVDVASCINKIFCAQALFIESAKEFVKYNPSCKIDHGYFPCKIPSLDFVLTSQRFIRGVCGTQWIGWKRHKKFIPLLKDISIKWVLCNHGVQYYYIRKTDSFKDYVTDRSAFVKEPKIARVEEKALHLGHISQDVFGDLLLRSMYSIDYSKRGYVNYTHWEPLIRGCFTLVHEEVIQNPYCKLNYPELSKSVVPFNDTNLPSVIDTLRKIPYSEIVESQKRSWQFCKENLDQMVVTKKFLEFALN